MFSVRNFGKAAELVGVEVDDDYREKKPFSIRFIPPFRRHNILDQSAHYEPIREIVSGARYQIVFDFDKTNEPRLQTEEQVDFEGSAYLIFQMETNEGRREFVTQEVKYQFMFDQGRIQHTSLHGIADESILQFYPPYIGAVDFDHLDGEDP